MNVVRAHGTKKWNSTDEAAKMLLSCMPKIRTQAPNDPHGRVIGYLPITQHLNLYNEASKNCAHPLNEIDLGDKCLELGLCTPTDSGKLTFTECFMPINIFSPDAHVLGDYIITPRDITFLPSNVDGLFIDAEEVPNRWRPCECVIKKLRSLDRVSFPPNALSNIATATEQNTSIINRNLSCHVNDLWVTAISPGDINSLEITIDEDTLAANGANEQEYEDHEDRDEMITQSYEAAWDAVVETISDYIGNCRVTEHRYSKLTELTITCESGQNYANITFDIAQRCPSLKNLEMTGIKALGIRLPAKLEFLKIENSRFRTGLTLPASLEIVSLSISRRANVGLQNLTANCKVLSLKNAQIVAFPREGNRFGDGIEIVHLNDCIVAPEVNTPTNWMNNAKPHKLAVSGEDACAIVITKNPGILSKVTGGLFIRTHTTITGNINAKKVVLRTGIFNLAIGANTRKITVTNATLGSDFIFESPETLTYVNVENSFISEGLYGALSVRMSGRETKLDSNTVVTPAGETTVVID